MRGAQRLQRPSEAEVRTRAVWRDVRLPASCSPRFGFNYKTKEAASHSHPKCDCRVVPSFGKGPKVKGYDPDGMYDRSTSAWTRSAGATAIRSGWDALPDAEREAYIKEHGGKASKAFDKYVNKRMVEEIETRDPEMVRNWHGTKNRICQQRGGEAGDQSGNRNS